MESMEYNKVFRFGRALVVDGKVENLGYYDTEEEVLEIYRTISESSFPKSCTAPYH